jgi:hypothetical protein
MHSSGGKLVTFEDESQRQQAISTKRPSTAITKIQSKPKYDHNRSSMNYVSDDDKTHTSESDANEYIQPTRPGIITDIQPSPRKNTPTTGVSALVSGNVKPTIVNNTKTISAIVRPQTTFKKYESER